MELLAFSAETWTAAGTWATVLVLFGTLIYVIQQVREVQELRREQFRPWVTVSFHFRSIVAFIAVKNVGTTVARNIRIRFDPDLVSTSEEGLREVAMFSEEIPAMVPGEQRIALFDQVPDRLRSDLPSRHRATVEYMDHKGRVLDPNEFILDFELLSGQTLPDKGIHELVEEVAKIRNELKSSPTRGPLD